MLRSLYRKKTDLVLVNSFDCRKQSSLIIYPLADICFIAYFLLHAFKVLNFITYLSLLIVSLLLLLLLIINTIFLCWKNTELLLNSGFLVPKIYFLTLRKLSKNVRLKAIKRILRMKSNFERILKASNDSNRSKRN